MRKVTPQALTRAILWWGDLAEVPTMVQRSCWEAGWQAYYQSIQLGCTIFVELEPSGYLRWEALEPTAWSALGSVTKQVLRRDTSNPKGNQ